MNVQISLPALLSILGDTHSEVRLLDGRNAFEPNMGLLKPFSSLSEAVPVSVCGLWREQTHLCLLCTCSMEQRSTSVMGHWAHTCQPISGTSHTHTHTHKQRCRPSTSVTEDTGKAPAPLSPPAPSFSTAEAGPRLPGAPTSPVPTPPDQVKSGEELSRGQGRQATPWNSASGHQGTNPGPWPRLCPSALGTKPGQGCLRKH